MARNKATRPSYSLAKRGGYFYVQWWENNRSRRVSCGTAEHEEATKFLAEFVVARDTLVKPDDLSIGKIVESYINERKDKVASDTIIYDGRALLRHMAAIPYDLFNKNVVARYIEDRRAEGVQGAPAKYRKVKRPISNGTLIRELGVLRAAFEWARKERWIVACPDVPRPSAPPARQRWLSRDEADKLIASADALHLRLFICIGLYTAARTGAILDLTWDRVNLETGFIDFGSGHGRKLRTQVPIIPELRDELALAADAATSDYVVEFRSGRVGSVKKGFEAACKRAQLSGVTPHILRHTAASWMVQQGVPISWVADYLGNSETMVRKVYGKLHPDYRKAVVNALSRPLGRGLKSGDLEKSE